MTSEKLLHARFFQFEGKADNKVMYDPHKFGLDVIQTMAEYGDNWFPTNCIAYYHKAKSDIGHQVHVAATAKQWDKAKEFLKYSDNCKPSPMAGSDRTFDQ